MCYFKILLQIRLLLFLLLYSFTAFAQTNKPKDYLVLFVDTTKNEYGYKNQNGDTVIQLGKYNICFTDTFRTYTIVFKKSLGFVAIDRQQKILYNVLALDNGPDYSSEGLFRILKKGKIGYADSLTGKIIIRPTFDCALPFENGGAKVSKYCDKVKFHDGHIFWSSHRWFYIDRTGRKVKKVEET